MLALRGRWGLLRRSAGTAVAYGLVGVAGCQVFYFYAISQMPVGVALLIEYTGSILVVAWLWLRHGQRPRRLTIGGAAGGGRGAGADGGDRRIRGSVQQGRRGRRQPGGPAVGGAGRGEHGRVLRAIGGHGQARRRWPARPRPTRESLPPIALAWAGMWVGAVALGVLLAVHALPFGASASDVTLLRHQVPPIVPIAGIALLSTAVGYSTGIVAARRLGAKLASFIGMAEILFAVIYAWILLGQLPSATQFLGGALILAGVSLVKIDESYGRGWS